MNTVNESSQSTGPTSQSSETCESVEHCQPLTSLLAAIPAKRTAEQDNQQDSHNRRSVMSSSELLLSVALGLFSGRTRHLCDQMPLGLGGDSDRNLSDLVTLCCPSDSEPVALALTTEESGCSCSPNFPTPCARDYKGMSSASWRAREGAKAWSTLPNKIGGMPHPEFVEELIGFPTGYSELKPSETQSCPNAPNSSEG